jgi:hypothetical protein
MLLSAATIVPACCVFSIGGASAAEATKGPVDGVRIANADNDPSNWLTYGRICGEQRFSPRLPHRYAFRE